MSTHGFIGFILVYDQPSSYL